ncbi:hypothetical protein Poli38472_014207 [Pythium oligandrum]|uniref:AAA+ ATPase domain-containing protein n=1 Tax=Pythium oligandrum TaxID=41045 RepID=A0A8K1CIZ4_PYTOL|nr:hypothetical protein Poli38472_014207 [Pythium oligandrum]|eukprot:TMW64090.1 hypothetical protein Poli38472_014207 [Pythium oligandrum]
MGVERLAQNVSALSMEPSVASTAPSSPAYVQKADYRLYSDKYEGLLLDLDAQIAKGFQVVGVHFQALRSSVFGLVSMTLAWEDTPDSIWVIPLITYQLSKFFSVLLRLLTTEKVVKVFHGVRWVAHELQVKKFHLGGHQLQKCLDLQIYYEEMVDKSVRDADLLRVAYHWNQTSPYHLVKNRAESSLTDDVAKHTAVVATFLRDCYRSHVVHHTNFGMLPVLYQMTGRRWRFSMQYGDQELVWFDKSSGYQHRSLECLGEAGIAPQLKSTCELEPLLAVLPERYRQAILDISGIKDGLVDICLDVGRTAHVCRKDERVALSSDGQQFVVTKAEIDEIIENLGGEYKIGDDNRAGIDCQLHRISVMRSKSGEIYGMTMRVGRALEQASNFLLDLLMASEYKMKSILLLGHPGSGKTTLIRDIARCVSESGENVCIVDTSNEIGGDGLIPHSCVGWARRMMVRSLDAQASVMIECVQNHTVSTLIIDEIGRKAEVNSAGTVKQRGPRIIASAHGDFRSLIKNQDLKGLIGGVQNVVVGDSAAKASNKQSKVQAQRSGNPVFDVIVELDHVNRGVCRIIPDVARAVDDVLKGEEYDVMTRKQCVGVPGIQIVRK